jgi:hypothetical protein
MLTLYTAFDFILMGMNITRATANGTDQTARPIARIAGQRAAPTTRRRRVAGRAENPLTDIGSAAAGGNATADRMSIEAARRTRAITAEVGQAVPPIETHKAFEYACHISKGNSVTIVSAEESTISR